jgi:flagellar hook-associated protein 3 FlgL
MNERMLNASLKTQARMADKQLQEASGLVSTDYGGLGSAAQKLLNLEVAFARSQSYEASGSSASNRIEAMYATLSSVTDVLTSFRAELVALQSTDGTDSLSLNTSIAAQVYLEELAGLLNTQYGGYYVFSGSATSTAPVDLSGYAATDADTSDTSYYKGAGDKLTARVSEEQTVTYGVNADDEAFEQAFRALSLIAGANGTMTSEDIEAALNLITAAVDGVAARQAGVSIAASSVERAITAQQDLQSFLEANISGIRDVDVTAIAVELTAYETQLQASYAALASIQSLNLLDYLR